MSPKRLRAGKTIEYSGDLPPSPEIPTETNPPPSPKIPAVLFEGDESPKTAQSIETQKFDLGSPRQPEPPKHQHANLPDAYGTGKLLLNARDPHSLFAHWDLNEEQQHQYNRQSADGHLTLRAYAHAHSNQPVVEVPVPPDTRHQFLNVERADTSYVGELGYYQADRTWKTIATSGPATTPPDAPATDTAVVFSTPQALQATEAAPPRPPIIPVTVPRWPFEPESSDADEQTPAPVARFQASQASLEDAPPFVKRLPFKKWSTLQEQLLAEIIRVSLERREWISSAEIAELVRNEVGPRRFVPAAISSPELPWSVLSAAPVSISSPTGEDYPGRKGFWFNVNAELVIYGATEPNAQVTLAGQPITLRPDGTFSCHFALPDGDYALDAAAISQENEQRGATMDFSRHTKSSGEVGMSPQNLSLERLPQPE